MKRWSLLLVALFLAAAGAGVYGFSKLSYNVDIMDLLPQDLPGLGGTRRMRDAFQQQDRLVITMTDRNTGLLQEAVDSLTARLDSRTEMCVKVRNGATVYNDPKFFPEVTAYTWLNAPPDRVTALAASLQPPALEAKLTATLEELAVSADGKSMALGAYDPLGLSDQGLNSLGGVSPAKSGGDGFRSVDGTFQIVAAEPAMQLPDYRATATWIEQVRAEIAKWKTENPRFAGVASAFTGEPMFRAEIATGMERDMTQSVGFITVIVGVLFWLLNRTVKPLFLLMLALLCTNLITLGLAGVFFGSLNVMSIGFAAILTGMVEDFGVVGLHEAQTMKNPTWAQVARRVVPGVFWSAVTAAAVFGSLALSSLPGISQLGMMTAIGILTGALVMVCGFLPLALRLKLPPPHRPANGKAGWLARRSGVIAGGIALTCLAVLAVRGLPGMNRESSVLRPVHSEAFSAMELLQDKMQPEDKTGVWVPLVVSGTPAQVSAALNQGETILKTAEAAGETSEWFLPNGFFPRPETQAKNGPVLAALAADIPRLRAAFAEAGFETEGDRHAFALTEAVLTRWQEWAAAPESPRWPGPALMDGPVGNMVRRAPTEAVAMGFARLRAGDTIHTSPLLPRLSALPGMEPSGWPFLTDGMRERVGPEVLRVCLPAGIGLAVLLWLAFRSVREVLLAVATLAFSALVLLAYMSAFSIEWNIVNIAAVPLSLGLGLDFTIHMIYSLRRTPADGGDGGRGVGRALLYCGLSTGLGFGSLALSGNKGLITMGQCCTVGVLATLFTAACLLPWAWGRWGRA